MALGEFPLSLLGVHSQLSYKALVVDAPLLPLRTSSHEKRVKVERLDRSASFVAELRLPGDGRREGKGKGEGEGKGRGEGKGDLLPDVHATKRVITKQERRAARDRVKAANPLSKTPASIYALIMKKMEEVTSESAGAEEEEESFMETNIEWQTKWRNRCERFAKTERPEDFGQHLSELVSSCMNKNPRLRPSTRQLLLHPFLLKSRDMLNELKAFLKLQRAKLNGIDSVDGYE
eukprot:754113-Hanusia_phi.AAC.1